MMSIVRDPMYKYSKPAENRFFSVSQLSFLFVIYARNLDAQSFTDEKWGKTQPRVKQEVRTLELEALR